MSSLIQDFVKNYGEITEFDLNNVFTKSGNLTKRTIGLKQKSFALVKLMKGLNIKTKADYESYKAKIELDNYEKVHGKISAKDIASVFNKDGKLTKRITKKNEQLVNLMTTINANKKADLNNKLNKISEIETLDKVEKEPKVFVKKPVKKSAKKHVKNHDVKPVEIKEVIEIDGPVQETISIEQLEPENHIESTAVLLEVDEHDLSNKYDETTETDYVSKLKDIKTFDNGVTFNFGSNFNVRYNRLKPAIIEFLNTKDLNNYYFKYHVKGFDNKHWTTVPMNSDNIPKIKSFLDRETFFGMHSDEFDKALTEAGIDSRETIQTSNGLKLTESKLTIDMIDKITITSKAYGKKESKTQIYCDNGGAFYDAKLKPESAHLEQFTYRYQIFATQLDCDGQPRPEYKYNCLTWAFKQSGQFDDKTLEAIMVRCYTRLVSRKQLISLCEEFKIAIQVRKQFKRERGVQWDYIDARQQWMGYKGEDPIARIKLGLIRKHYFLDETVVGLESYYLKHMNEIPIDDPNKYKIQAYNKTRKSFKYNNRNPSINSRLLIELLEEYNHTTKLTFSERALMQSDLYQYVSNEITDINLHEKDFKLIEYKPKKSDSWPVYYADCETDVVSYSTHQAFCIACVARRSTDIKSYYGHDCLDQWLEDLPDKCIVYFHNLGYDGRLMNKYTSFNEIEKQGKIMTKTITYHGKVIKLKDSYSILTMKLSQFPRAFKLACGGKEMFPYRYYTFDRLETNKGLISEAGNEEIQWDTDALKTILSTRQIDKPIDQLKWDQHQFEQNIDAIPNCRINADGKPDAKGEYFDMKLYCDFYVKQDVRLLQEGFDAFRNILLDPAYAIDIDADNFLTMPSISSDFCMKNIFAPTENGMYAYSGIARAYIQKAVEGGRCMTRDNEKWHVTSVLNDFDAVSLYPSAMARLYAVSGTPTTIPKECLNVEYLLSHTAAENEQTSNDKPIAAYIVHIQITKVGIARHFPLIMKKTKKGGSTINMNVNECCEMYVDNIKLEDLIKYQGIECNILDGIMWYTSSNNICTKDFRIRDQIQRLHKLRCQLKKEGSAAQEVIKLMMNALYGKTIQKPIMTETVYKKIYTVKNYYRQYTKTGKETRKSIERFTKYADKIEFDKDGKEFIRLEKTPADNFMLKNHAKIRESFDIDVNLCAIVLNKQIDDFYTPTLIGVQILSMSKRIMNEVMCTAEDLEIPIFYQDTDSMHILNKEIDHLACEFKKRFGRELIGKELGQFHSDFDPLVKNGNNPVSIESYFLGKKCYIDHLRDDAGNEGYHIRMKGVTDNCIRLEAIEKFNNDPMKVYEYLANNESLHFDLAKVKAKFQNNKDRTISNVNNFARTVKFIGPLNLI